MAYTLHNCKAYNYANASDNLVFYPTEYSSHGIRVLQYGYRNSLYSTRNATVTWSKSCAKNDWPSNTQTFTISMDNALRNAVMSKYKSGGLVNISNYVTNLSQLWGKDMNGNNSMAVYGFIGVNHSITGGFDVTNYGWWSGNWPNNFPLSMTYSYNIPGVGNVSDTVMLITNGWYEYSDTRNIAAYDYNTLTANLSEQQILSPPSWSNHGGIVLPYNNRYGYGNMYSEDFAYFAINGIYSRNTGSRGCYRNNAADAILNAGSTYFGGLDNASLIRYAGASNSRFFAGNATSITNNIIMSITDINFINNTITVKFALSHDRDHAMMAFQYNRNASYAAVRINYNFPVTRVHQVQDSWSMSFINKSDFNPTLANGQGPSTVVWDSSNHAVVLTAGSFVNNDNGFSKIISREGGVLQCSCANINNTLRVTIGGYSITVPSGTTSFDVRIICINNNNTGYWRITPPAVGFTHSFTIKYAATEDAPLVSFQNELYTAITQAINNNGVPYIFELRVVNSEYSISITGLVRCDITMKDNKTYHAISVYDVNGDFSSILVRNGMYVTMPVTITTDIQIVNNEILVKAGYASIGFTSTSIGVVSVSSDAIATLLPAVATVSKGGSRIGYATTTVNQNSFAFSFSALKEEVEQTDDFVSHYLS